MAYITRSKSLKPADGRADTPDVSVAGSSYVPPVQLGATHALAARDHGEKKDQSKRRKPGQTSQDEVELTALAPEELPPDAVSPAAPTAPVAYSAHGAAPATPERHIDVNG